MNNVYSKIWSSSPTRLMALIGVGILVISAEVGLIYGERIFQELFTAKVIGDGDSLMASSSVLERLRRKHEINSDHPWFSQNNARNGYRMGIEVAEEQRWRLFPYRLPWKVKDRVWVIGGTNDLGIGGRNRVEALLDAVRDYFEKQRQAGYPKSSCFYTDILPRHTPGDLTFESDRLRYNSMIAGHLAGLAHVIPSGSNPLLANPLNTEIYFDGTHLTEAGNEILAEDAFRVMNEKELAEPRPNSSDEFASSP